MILNKKGFLSFFVVALIIFNQGCDESVFRENPPIAYLELESLNYIHTVGDELVSEPIELEQVQYGDSIGIAIALKVDDMVDLYNMIFSVAFDKDHFRLDSTDFAFSDNNFFAQSEELFLDCGSDGVYDEEEEGYDAEFNIDPSNDNWSDDNPNGTEGNGIFDWEDLNGNGLWDEGEGESFTDSVDNDVWDAFNEPEGNFFPTNEQINFEGLLNGNIGVGAPEQNGTVWGSGVICYMYFSGVMHPSFFDLTIIEANDLGSAGPESVQMFSWDIFSFSLESPDNPTVQILGNTVEDDEITVSLYIEDSSPLSYFKASFTYDTAHLDYQQTNFGGFFSDPPYNLSTTSLPSSGEIYFTSKIEGIDESDIFAEIVLDPSSLSEGSGNIINIVFDIVDSEIESTSLHFDLIQVLGYNSFLGIPIPLNTQFWEFDEDIPLDLTTFSAIDG